MPATVAILRLREQSLEFSRGHRPFGLRAEFAASIPFVRELITLHGIAVIEKSKGFRIEATDVPKGGFLDGGWIISKFIPIGGRFVIPAEVDKEDANWPQLVGL